MKLQNTLIHHIETYGKTVNVNGQLTKECIDLSFNIIDFDYILSIEEDTYVKNKLEKYQKQILYALNKLILDKNTRQAVIQFNATDKLPECITQYQFLIRRGKFITIVTSRSLDVKNKLCQDIEIAKRISDMLNTDKFPVTITFHVGSCHFYL